MLKSVVNQIQKKTVAWSTPPEIVATTAESLRISSHFPPTLETNRPEVPHDFPGVKTKMNNKDPERIRHHPKIGKPAPDKKAAKIKKN